MSFHSSILNAATLAKDAEVCCVLDGSLQFLYCNPAWDDFARSNKGNPDALGQSLLHKRLLPFVPEVLRPFFAEHFHALRAGGCLWRHQYECSSPTEFRVFEMQALHLPVEDEILICHKPLVSRPHTRSVVEPRRRARQPVRMCSHCRLTCHDEGSNRWDWIPHYLENPPRHIDDLCPPCALYYREGARFLLRDSAAGSR